MNDNSSSAPEAIIARIDEHARERGMTRRALAAEAGLSTTQMSRLMNGDRKLTAGDLASIASALGVSASVLLGQAEPQRPLSVAQRLGREGRPARLDGPFMRAGELLKLRDLLDQLFVRDEHEPVELVVPATSHYATAGRRMARQVREVLGLGSAPIDDLEALAARFDLDVATQPMPANLHGLLVDQPAAGSRPGAAGATVVFGAAGTGKTAAAAMALLNALDTNGRRRYTLAHELGHLLFADSSLFIPEWAEKDDRPAMGSKAGLVEHRADCFAAHLLAPDAAVKAVADEVTGELGSPLAGMPGDEFGGTVVQAGAAENAVVEEVARWTATLAGRLAGRYGISVESALIRAEDSKTVKPEQRQLVRDTGWSASYILELGGENRHDVAATADGVVPPFVMLGQALSAYQNGMLGVRPLATLYDTDDLDGLARDLAEAGWAPEYAGA
jgi:Zn-dependent peptidase ImmA (M78 family)